MELPPGYTYRGCRYVLLNKTLYGLVQAAFEWYMMFCRCMIEKFGFIRNLAEPCLIMKFDAKTSMSCMILFHVDNVMTACNQLRYVKYLIAKVKHDFTLSFANSESLLGIAVLYDLQNRQIKFHQISYILSLVQKFDIDVSKKADKPIRSMLHERFKRPDDTSLVTKIRCKKPFLELLYSIFWIARCTRYECLFACVFWAHFCCCYMS